MRGPAARPSAVFGPEAFVGCVGGDTLTPLAAAGGFAYVDPDEPTTHGRIVAVWADGHGSATLVWLMVAENGRSVLRAASPGRRDMETTCANETMTRTAAVFVGRAV